MPAIAQPVSVCHQWSITGTLEHAARPTRPCRRIGALAGEEQRAEFRQVVLREQLALRVLLLDGAERGRRGEQRDAAVLGDDPPERAGIGRADRLALVQDRGAAVQQRRVDDVGMADDPADVGGRPEHLARARCRRCSASTISARPCGRRCRARRPWAGRSCRTCRGCRADRSRRPARSRPSDSAPIGASSRALAQSWSRPAISVGLGLRPLQDQAGRRACAWRARSPRRAAACR